MVGIGDDVPVEVGEISGIAVEVAQVPLGDATRASRRTATSCHLLFLGLRQTWVVT